MAGTDVGDPHCSLPRCPRWGHACLGWGGSASLTAAPPTGLVRILASREGLLAHKPSPQATTRPWAHALGAPGDMCEATGLLTDPGAPCPVPAAVWGRGCLCRVDLLPPERGKKTGNWSRRRGRGRRRECECECASPSLPSHTPRFLGSDNRDTFFTCTSRHQIVSGGLPHPRALAGPEAGSRGRWGRGQLSCPGPELEAWGLPHRTQLGTRWLPPWEPWGPGRVSRLQTCEADGHGLWACGEGRRGP